MSVNVMVYISFVCFSLLNHDIHKKAIELSQAAKEIEAYFAQEQSREQVQHKTLYIPPRKPQLHGVRPHSCRLRTAVPKRINITQHISQHRARPVHHYRADPQHSIIRTCEQSS